MKETQIEDANTMETEINMQGALFSSKTTKREYEWAAIMDIRLKNHFPQRARCCELRDLDALSYKQHVRSVRSRHSGNPCLFCSK